MERFLRFVLLQNTNSRKKIRNLGIGIVIITIVFLNSYLPWNLRGTRVREDLGGGGMQVCVRVEIIYIR